MRPGIEAFLAGWRKRDAERPMPREQWPKEVRAWADQQDSEGFEADAHGQGSLL